jgi:hypothetical protein
MPAQFVMMTLFMPLGLSLEFFRKVPGGLVHVLVCSTAFVTSPFALVKVVRQRNVAVGIGSAGSHLKLNVSGDGVLE